MSTNQYIISTAQRQIEIQRATNYCNDRQADRALRDINIAVWLVVVVLTVAVTVF